ncbi:hypothetical protein [Nocardiopsis valliformis]|uniref:hypothetical protein n=1 Tax=Nocardiopsis valliformis TaxID=239974 RepID=UPI0003616C8A|nr:hypothetical protein [Nocardiopsis valliformis]
MTEFSAAQVVHTHATFAVDLSTHRNNIALTTPETLRNGMLNVWGNSLPAETLRTDCLRVGRVRFAGVRANGTEPDNVRCAGQYVDLPEIEADWIHLLATSERRCEEEVGVHYASGAATTEWVRVSDFLPARARFGELAAARSSALHYPHHRQEDLSGQVWAVRVPVTRWEAVRGLRLPDNPALHVFAISVEGVR